MASQASYHLLQIPMIAQADTSDVKKLQVNMDTLHETVKVLGVENTTARKDIRDLTNCVDKLTQKIKESIELKENMGPLHVQRYTNFVRKQESIPSRNVSSMLPCVSLLELDKLLDHVMIDSNFTQLKEYIKSLCGEDVKISIKRVFDNLVDKSVQKQLSWSGFRTKKPSFEKVYKRIVDAINAAMMETYDKKSYNYDKLAMKIGTLLRGA